MSHPVIHPTPAGLSGDQAAGLRRMFAGDRALLVPLVANPHVGRHGALLARVAGAFAEQGLRTLVVDAADTAPAPSELAFLDLPACVEPLAPSLAYLAARGLPMQQVDTFGSCAAFASHMMQLLPDTDVVVMHAEARVLARMLGGRDAMPLLMASSEPGSLTHAYAALKLLAQRLACPAFELVLPASGYGPRPAQIATRLADCADRFLGMALRDWAAVDPSQTFGEPAGSDLHRLATARLGGRPSPRAATPSTPEARWATAPLAMAAHAHRPTA